MSQRARKQIRAEMAMAEAVIDSDCDETKQYGPMIDNHRGQWLAYAKILGILDCEEIAPGIPLKIERNIKITFTWPAIVMTIICLISLF